MTVEMLPHVNACLNATSAILLAAGYICIRRGKVTAHKTCMLAAFVASSAFLACYLIYHFQVGHVRFSGEGVVRLVYVPILATHVVLAVFVVPLALWTLYHAARNQFDRHRRIARWTLPIWLYVSVTGVVVYWMLYRVY